MDGSVAHPYQASKVDRTIYFLGMLFRMCLFLFGRLIFFISSLATCKQRTTLWKQLSKERENLRTYIDSYNDLVGHISTLQIGDSYTLVTDKHISDGTFPWLSHSQLNGEFLDYICLISQPNVICLHNICLLSTNVFRQIQIGRCSAVVGEAK